MCSQPSTAPFNHTGDSANIAFYRERDGKLWCEVLCVSFRKVDGQWKRLTPNEYSVVVYRDGQGELGTFRHKPKTGKGTLPDRTVTRIVREWLALKADVSDG